MKTKIVSCHTTDSKPFKQEVNGTVILPPLVFPGQTHIIMYLGGDLAPSSRRSITVDIPKAEKAGWENDVSIVQM